MKIDELRRRFNEVLECLMTSREMAKVQLWDFFLNFVHILTILWEFAKILKGVILIVKLILKMCILFKKKL